MMRKILFLLLGLLMIASVSAIVVKTYPYEVKPGLNEIKVIVLNHGDSIKNAHVSFSIQDLDISQEVQMNLKTGKVANTYVSMDISEDAKGYYPVRITIADKSGVQRKTHTWVYVE